jgi:hypothetical protein
MFFQQLNWKSPLSVNEKKRRAFRTTVSLYLILFSLLFLVNLFFSKGKVHFNILQLTTFLCFPLPFSIMAGVGSYLGITTLDNLYITGKKKFEKKK